MTYKQNKLVLAATLLTIVPAGSVSAMFEVKFDGSDIIVNGYNIKESSQPVANVGFSCLGGYLASTCLTNKEQSPLQQLNITLAGATAGWLASEFLYKKIGTKPLVDVGFSCLGGYLASKYFTHEKQSPLKRLNTTLAGATVGWMSSDLLYKNVTTKRMLAKTATGASVIAAADLLTVVIPPL